MAQAYSSEDLLKVDPLKTVTPKLDPILSQGQGIIDSAGASVIQNQGIVDTANKALQDNIKRQNELSISRGEKASDTAKANETFGVNAEQANYDKYNQELNLINANIQGLSREAQAIPLQIQEQFKNTGATDRGVAPIQTGKLRENAIKALTQASLADIAVANVNNSAIRYNAAKDKVTEAINLKYQPIENEIATLKEQLALNKEYILDPAEKRLVSAQEKVLAERTRLIADQKAKEQALSTMKIDVQKNQAPQAILSKVLNAKTIEELQAIPGISTYLMSPVDRLDLQLKGLQIQKANNDLAPKGDKMLSISEAKDLGVPFGTTESQAIKLQAQQFKTQNELSRNTLMTKVTDIDNLIKNPALKVVVGPTALARAPLSPQRLVGATDNFLASVSQLTSAETLQTLTDLKKSGTSLGSVTEKELQLLKESATKIAKWEVVKDGVVVGYKIDEGSFQKELQSLKKHTQNYLDSLGGPLQSQEQVANNFFDEVGTALQSTNNIYSNAGYDLN